MIGWNPTECIHYRETFTSFIPKERKLLMISNAKIVKKMKKERGEIPHFAILFPLGFNIESIERSGIRLQRR